MPAFLWALGSLFLRLTGSFVGRVLVALGISVVTYTGMQASLDWLKAGAVSALGSLPPQVVGMLGVLRVGQCISIVCSAIVARMIVNGMQSDTVKRWVMR